MKAHRVAWLIASAALVGAGAFAAACSNASTHGFVEDDAGEDATIDVAKPSDAGGTKDAAGEASQAPESGGPQIEAGCSAVNTACDIVLQNCPADSNGNVQQCQQAGGGVAGGTVCAPPLATQHLPKGHACCSAANAPEQCGPGLRCIGPDVASCNADGGALTGRCTPACCADDVCGKSDPEGFAGRCSLSIVDGNNTEMFKVCDYDPPCKPFHVESCPQGFTCIVEDQFGTASCVPIYNDKVADGGSTAVGLLEGAQCDSLNSCADGLLCLGPPDGGSTCTWLCLTPGTNPPFDAGGLRDGAAGYGGCPPSERCLGQITGAIPPWISFCTP